MSLRPLVGATVLLALLAAGCGGDDTSQDAAPTEEPVTEPTGTTEPPTFDGDPDSEFCQRSREAAEQPVLDPFAAGIEPQEVELRFRALAQRFEGFAEIAPDVLADDLQLLDESFEELAVALEEADYDFARLAEEDVDISTFDDPALAAVAERLAAYQAQVCARP